MAEFLASTKHIVTRIENIVGGAKEVIYLASPTLSQIPKPLLTMLWDATKQGVKVNLIYREISESNDNVIISLQNSRIRVFHNSNLNTSVYLNEKEAVLTSFGLFAAEQTGIEFGACFRKAYAAAMFVELLKEVQVIMAGTVRMEIENAKLVSQEEVWARNAKPEVKTTSDETLRPISTKILTVKEKQEVILKIFTREYQDCTLKIEDAERMRLYGKGIVFALSKERVDIIFVHYEAFQSQLEAVKQFMIAKHPDIKMWFQYNRINMKLELESEIVNVFPTVGEAVTSFGLIG
jgi:hypothetical protein